MAGLLALALLAPVSVPAREEAPRVVASILPLHALASVVLGEGGDANEPTLLIPPAASPHAYRLRPSGAAALARADVVLWVGPALETVLVRPLETLPPREAVLLTAVEIPGMVIHPARRGGVWSDDHDHDQDQDQDQDQDHLPAGGEERGTPSEESGSGESGTESGTAESGTESGTATFSGGVDPHLWLDPRNAVRLAAALADALARVDPARGSRYRARAGDLAVRLRALDAEIERRLAPVRNEPFLVQHDAFQYLERRYGLHALGAVAASVQHRPGARRLRALRDLVAAGRVRCLFREPQLDPRLGRALAQGTGLVVATLDPIGANLRPGPGAYERLLRGAAEAIAGCLAGGPNAGLVSWLAVDGSFAVRARSR